MQKGTVIKVTWKAFGDQVERGRFISTATVNITWTEFRFDQHIQLLRMIYENTNLYQGAFWDLLEPVLPANRTHTALSVGDEVEIDGAIYRCDDIGWKLLNNSEINA